jgi:iron-sulfur cluster assembly protein
MSASNTSGFQLTSRSRVPPRPLEPALSALSRTEHSSQSLRRVVVESAENVALSAWHTVCVALGRTAKRLGSLMMIELTDSAVNAIRSAIAGSDGPVQGLRIMVEAGGCAGYKYMMGLVSDRQPEDVVIEKADIRVFLDPSSVELLQGTTVDFSVSLEGSGFTFNNPNASSSCSCGKSFG